MELLSFNYAPVQLTCLAQAGNICSGLAGAPLFLSQNFSFERKSTHSCS
jgi:hypothetical protein